MINRSIEIGLLLSFVCLLGCATAKTIIGPDGTVNQLISCHSIEDCYEKAREVCNGPYKIINTSSQTSGFNGNTSSEIKLLVKCRK